MSTLTANTVDRIVLDRKTRDVKFYLRKNTYKKCLHNLSEEQISNILAAIRKAGRETVEDLVFDDDVYILTPKTKRLVK